MWGGHVANCGSPIWWRSARRKREKSSLYNKIPLIVLFLVNIAIGWSQLSDYHLFHCPLCMLVLLWLIYSQYIIGKNFEFSFVAACFWKIPTQNFHYRAGLELYCFVFFFLSTKYYTLLTVYLTLVVTEFSMAARLCLRYIRRVKIFEVVRHVFLLQLVWYAINWKV